MPIRLCAEPTCPNRAEYRGRCPDHAQKADRAILRRGQGMHRTKRWYVLRRHILTNQPLCACGEIATDVDHIVPIPEGPAWEVDNLRPMCKACHSRKTKKEQATR